MVKENSGVQISDKIFEILLNFSADIQTKEVLETFNKSLNKTWGTS